MNIYKKQGFTLIEFLITLAVAAVLLAFAVPDFSTLTMNKRITTQANEFVSSLALARAEALKRVSRVTVCSSSDGQSCAGSGGWEQGWIVFNDKDNDAAVDHSFDPLIDEPIVRSYSALTDGNTLRGSSNVDNYVSFVAGGTAKLTSGAFQSGTIVLCDIRGPGENARAISVNITGRTRVEDTAPDTCAP